MPTAVTEAARFLASGGGATAVHVVTAVLLIEGLEIHPGAANGIAFLVATATTYTLNTYWTFARTATRRNLARFLLVAALGGAMSVAITSAAEWRGLHYGMGILLLLITVPPLTFLLHKYWTYR